MNNSDTDNKKPPAAPERLTTRPPKHGGLSHDDSNDHGIERDTRGQEQPTDKSRAQQSAGDKAQRDAALDQSMSPGEPAGGE